MTVKEFFLKKRHQKFHHPLFSPFFNCCSSNYLNCRMHKWSSFGPVVMSNQILLQQINSFSKKTLELLKLCLTVTKLTIFVTATSLWYLCQRISIHILSYYQTSPKLKNLLFLFCKKIHVKYTKVYQYTKKPFIVKYILPVTSF